MAIPYTAIFTDLGKNIKFSNKIKTLDTDLDTIATELEAIFDDDADDIDYLAEVIATLNAVQGSCGNNIARVTNRVNDYITSDVLMKDKLDNTYSTVSDIIDDLIAKMTTDSESVDGNAVSFWQSWVESGDNNNQLSGYANLKGVKSDNCYQVTDEEDEWVMDFVIVDDGAGFYHVDIYKDVGHASLIGHTASYNGTGIKAIVEDNASEMGGTITVDAATAVDADIKLTFSFDGTRAGTGYMSAWKATQMALENDDDVRVECTSAATEGSERWGIYTRLRAKLGTNATTAVSYPGTNVDVGGVEFTISTRDYVIRNDGAAQLSNPSFSGAEKVTNCNADGELFCTLVGKFAAIAENGDNNNQLSGWENVTGLTVSGTCDATGTLYVSIVDEGGGAWRVDFFNDVARGGGDLVGHTAIYTAIGDQAITEDNDSGFGGIITIDAVVAADVNINVDYPFIQISGYKEVGKINLVCQSLWTLGDENGPDITVLALAEQNSSGLTGTIDVAYTADDLDIYIRLDIPFIAGDQFLFSLEGTDDGTFQSYFRDQIGLTLPYELDGTETIADALAE